MKISVLCASRNNENGLDTVFGALNILSSGRHEIFYQSDDGLYPSLGEVWNNLAALEKSDLYALVTDRALCITPHWDLHLADIYSRDDTRVFWWTTNAGPVIPIVPHKWLEAAGQIYTDYFPFWFDDTWLQELSALVHGLPIYGTQATCYIAKKNPMTKRMRDLRFWMDFFIAKRPERIEHAAKIREKLQLPMPDMVPVKEWFKANEANWDSEWQNWEMIAGDKSEPDKTYIAAKKSAEEFLNARQP